MFGFGRGNNDRREPQFGTGRGGSDLRVSEDDRPYRSERARRRHEWEEDDDPPPPKARRQRPEKSRGRRRGTILGFLFKWTFVCAIWTLIIAGGVVAWYASRLPPTHSLEIPPRPPNIAILAADGTELASRGEAGGATVKLKSLPKHVPQALLAIEDRRFYSHFGIDLIGFGRAVVTNITRRGSQQGGSTLTQQLAKNLFLSPERTLGRKVQEALLALWLESNYSKNDILELYLNRVYFGAGAYGIEGAARRFYGKSATALTLQEAAVIAGLLKAPSKLNPTRNPQAAEARAQTVLIAMAEQGFITEREAKAAIADPAEANRAIGAASINYVADWVMDLLDDYVGKVEADIKVETTIVPAIQEAAEAALIDELARNGGKFNVKQGAVVVLDTEGAVRALVGGKNYSESQFNRAVTAKRQPGSAFKPFVYLAALEHGMTPSTLREDAPVAIKGWKPENYTRDYRGTVPLSMALAFSLNTVSVRLVQEVGPKSVVRAAQRMGINSRLDANPSIALGTSEVSLIELTNAYVPFANGGMGTFTHVINRVKSVDGRILYGRAPVSPGAVVDATRVAMMNAMMTETIAIGTARKAVVPGFPVAGKTGTSQDYRDAWFIGYTGKYVTGVWLGNDDGTPTRKTTGSGLPVDIWAKVMAPAHKGMRPVDLPGAWRPIAAAARQGRQPGPEMVIDQPMSMNRAGTEIDPTPTGSIDRSAAEKAKGFLDRLFR